MLHPVRARCDNKITMFKMALLHRFCFMARLVKLFYIFAEAILSISARYAVLTLYSMGYF